MEKKAKMKDRGKAYKEEGKRMEKENKKKKMMKKDCMK